MTNEIEKNEDANKPQPQGPFQEEEQQGNEQPRQAPGVEREYQGGASDERRAPGEGDDPTEDIDKKIA